MNIDCENRCYNGQGIQYLPCEKNCEIFTGKNVFVDYCGLSFAAMLFAFFMIWITAKPLYWYFYEFTDSFSVSIFYHSFAMGIIHILFAITRTIPCLFCILIFVLTYRYYLKLKIKTKNLEHDTIRICKKYNLIAIDDYNDFSKKILFENIDSISIINNENLFYLYGYKNSGSYRYSAIVIIKLNTNEKIEFTVRNSRHFRWDLEQTESLRNKIKTKEYMFIPTNYECLQI